MIDNSKEYILCAANYYNDNIIRDHKPINIEKGFIICGQRHHNCIEIFARIYGFPYNEQAMKLHQNEKQGFLTSKNRYVSRKEAAIIAYNSGQIVKPIDTLYSEDLY